MLASGRATVQVGGGHGSSVMPGTAHQGGHFGHFNSFPFSLCGARSRGCHSTISLAVLFMDNTTLIAAGSSRFFAVGFVKVDFHIWSN